MVDESELDNEKITGNSLYIQLDWLENNIWCAM